MTPEREAARLAALRKYRLLDTPPEQVYDDIVRLARSICGVPIALISLVDANRQWFKAKAGLDACETPRDVSFCTHALENTEGPLIVPNATQDPRFASNPLVTSEPHIRFYAGVPLVDADGMALGTLCVIDRVPRTLNEEQLAALHALARQTVRQIETAHRMRALQESELRFNLFMDASPAMAFIKDEQGRYIYVNKTMIERVNLRAEDILGKDDFQLWPYDIARENRAHDLRVVTRRLPVNLVERAFNLDGSLSYWQVQKFPLSASGLLGGVAVDISAAKEYESQLKEYQQALEEQKKALEESVQHLEELSATDDLTGLKNRRAFDHILESEWAFSSRYGTPLSLLALDLDHFKQVNDTLGHPAGDKLLRNVAHVLKRNDRANDTAARIGGEEFIVVLPNTDMQGAAILAERIRREVEAIGVTTISIGIAGRDDATPQPEDMIAAADKALYAAKRSGRNRVCRHDEPVPEESRDGAPTEGTS